MPTWMVLLVVAGTLGGAARVHAQFCQPVQNLEPTGEMQPKHLGISADADLVKVVVVG